MILKDEFDEAVICNNGHAMNAYAKSNPDRNSRFCIKCGEKGIKKCSKCGRKIRGVFHSRESGPSMNYEIPRFCHWCGTAYPWTELKMKQAQTIIEEVKGLNSKEKEELKTTVDEIFHDTNPTAPYRFKELLKKVGKASGKMLYQLVVDISSETAKKILLGH
jgi:hypothetical protein